MVFGEHLSFLVAHIKATHSTNIPKCITEWNTCKFNVYELILIPLRWLCRPHNMHYETRAKRFNIVNIQKTIDRQRERVDNNLYNLVSPNGWDIMFQLRLPNTYLKHFFFNHFHILL